MDTNKIYTTWLKEVLKATDVRITVSAGRMLTVAESFLTTGVKPTGSWSVSDLTTARELINWAEEKYRSDSKSKQSPNIITSDQTPDEVKFLASILANKDVVTDKLRTLAELQAALRMGNIDLAIGYIGGNGTIIKEVIPDTITVNNKKFKAV